MWCGRCYQPYPGDPFPVQRTLDEEEEKDVETDESLSHRFACGRNKDHLMGIPFECDLCDFRNLNNRDPVSDYLTNMWTLLCIRRAFLDAFWSRESSTVLGNLSRFKLDYFSVLAVFSMECQLPVIGSEQVEDKVGMWGALFMLNASL